MFKNYDILVEAIFYDFLSETICRICICPAVRFCSLSTGLRTKNASYG